MEQMKQTILRKIEINKVNLQNILVDTKIDPIEMKEFLNAISNEQPILGYELNSNKTQKYEKDKRIIFLELEILNHKVINKIVNVIYKFLKQEPRIILLNKKETTFWIAFNRDFLINEVSKAVISKKIFISQPITSKKLWKKMLDWNQVDLTSINEVFDQIVRIIYHFNLQVETKKDFKSFQKTYDWNYFQDKAKINLLEKQKNKLIKEKNKSYNNNEKLSLSLKLKEIEQQINELKKQIKEKEKFFKS